MARDDDPAADDVGRKSGEPRTTPLIHRTDGERWVIVASKGGTPENPAWYENLLANPDATIQVKGEQIPVRAAPPRARSARACGR